MKQAIFVEVMPGHKCDRQTRRTLDQCRTVASRVLGRNLSPKIVMPCAADREATIDQIMGAITPETDILILPPEVDTYISLHLTLRTRGRRDLRVVVYDEGNRLFPVQFAPRIMQNTDA